MRFKGFSNVALNLGFVDVVPTKAKKLNFVTCATCGFTAKQMFYGECDHTYCEDCLLLLDRADDQQEVLEARCVLCKCDSSVMKVNIHESFIAGLQCHCPQCNITVQLGEFKGHLKACNNTPLINAVVPLCTNDNLTSEQNGAASNSGERDYIGGSKIPSSGGDQMGDSKATRVRPDVTLTQIVSSVRRELINMLSTTKDDLRNEFTQEIKTMETKMAEEATATPHRRQFNLAFDRSKHSKSIFEPVYIHLGDMILRFRILEASLLVNFIETYEYNLEITVVAVGEEQEKDIHCVLGVEMKTACDEVQALPKKIMNLTNDDLGVGGELLFKLIHPNKCRKNLENLLIEVQLELDLA